MLILSDAEYFKIYYLISGVQEMAILRYSQQILKTCTVCNEHCTRVYPVEFFYYVRKLLELNYTSRINSKAAHVRENKLSEYVKSLYCW